MHLDGDATKTLKPIGYCHGFVRCLRLSIRGQIHEDMQEFNMVAHMFNMFENVEIRLNDMCEGLDISTT